jgi:hypothetical protein
MSPGSRLFARHGNMLRIAPTLLGRLAGGYDRAGDNMRKIDLLAASAGLIACLIVGKPYPTQADNLAVEGWLLEQRMENAIVRASEPFAACYAATLPGGDAAHAPHNSDEQRLQMLIASTCYGDVSALSSAD